MSDKEFLRKNKSFYKSIMTLASGSIIAQCITILISPIMTRIYSPEEIGVFTLVTSIIGIFGPILSLRYESMIVPEEDNLDTYSLIVVSTFICIILSIITTIGYGLYFFLIKNMGLISFITSFFILLLLIITGLLNILIAYNNKLKEYKLMTSVYILRTAFQNAFLILFGCMGLGSMGLLSSNLIGNFAGVKRQSLSLQKNLTEIKQLTMSDLRRVLVKYKKQAILSTPAYFLNSFSYSSLNLFIENLFGTAILGYYSISYRILGMPLTVVSSNVSKVFFENAAKEYNDYGEITKSLHRTCLFLLPLAILLFIGLYISSYFFPLIFGSDWVEAGTYIRILAPLFSIKLIASTIDGPAFLITSHQQYDLYIRISLVLCSIMDFLYCSMFDRTIIDFLIYYSGIVSSPAPALRT